MAINFRGLFFVLLFLCLANVLFSQESTGGNRHRITWTKDNYALRYEVLIEREENEKYSNVLRQFTEEAFIFISLPPGSYRLRVIPYDFRDVPGVGSGWKNFKVLAVVTADPKSEPESQLVMEEPTPPPPPPPPAQEEAKIPQQEEPKKPMEIVADDEIEDTNVAKKEKQNDLYIALFAEGMGYSRYSIAGGAGALFGGSFDGKGVGLRLLFVQDAENFVFFETIAHMRLYLSSKKDNTGIFVQAEGGIVFFSFEKLELTDYFSFVGGISAGWRFMMNKQWYIEPFIHAGYPYVFGIGFSTGLRFDLNKKK